MSTPFLYLCVRAFPSEPLREECSPLFVFYCSINLFIFSFVVLFLFVWGDNWTSRLCIFVSVFDNVFPMTKKFFKGDSKSKISFSVQIEILNCSNPTIITLSSTLSIYAIYPTHNLSKYSLPKIRFHNIVFLNISFIKFTCLLYFLVAIVFSWNIVRLVFNNTWNPF